jgi:enoyl-CoA hydratase/carnithine racemase
MSIVDLKKEGDVFILTMQSGENRFNRTFIDAMNQALDTVGKSSGPAALITIGGEKKFHSNGPDLARLTGDVQSRIFFAKLKTHEKTLLLANTKVSPNLSNDRIPKTLEVRLVFLC